MGEQGCAAFFDQAEVILCYCDVITENIEEEDVLSYVLEDYYPVYIGEVFRSTDQVGGRIRIRGEFYRLAVQRS